MPHDKHDKTAVIPVDLIKETVMPPYEFQKPQNGFGSAGFEESQFGNHKEKESRKTVGKTNLKISITIEQKQG